METQSRFTPEQREELEKEWSDRLFYLKKRKARLGNNAPPELDSEISKIQDVIKDLDSDAQESMDYEHTDSFVKQATTHAVGISFLNRERELERIVNPLTSPFILVEAPAGYGKSYLLHQAREKLDKSGWLVCEVDFKQRVEASDSLPNFLELLLRSLQSEPEDENTLQTRDLLQAVVSRMSAQDKHIALLIDSAEQVRDREFAHQIRNDVIYAIAEHLTNIPGRKFRCVVAGRYIGQVWSDPHSKYFPATQCFGKPLRLTPFDFQVILETVQKMADAQPSGRGEEMIRYVARGVQFVCGGHPDSMVNLLIEIDEKYSLSLLRGYFARDDLFRQHLKPVCDKILRDVPEHIRPLFRWICMFRCYDQEIIATVIEWCRNKGLSECAELDSIAALEMLTQARLVTWNREKRFYVDDIVRRLLARWQRFEYEEDAYTLNDVALELFDRWLENGTLTDPVRCQTVIIEHLYHVSVKLARSPENPERATSDFRTELKRDLDRFERASFRSTHERLEIARILLYDLRGDEDIQAELTRATGGQPYEFLLEPLVNYIETNSSPVGSVSTDMGGVR